MDNWLLVAFALLGGILLGAFGLAPVLQMLGGTISLKGLVSEKDGKASLSRFQFLVFTFVVAISYFLLVIEQLSATETLQKLPGLDPTVLGLLGISGLGYLGSKGLQGQKEKNEQEAARPKQPQIGV